MARTALTALTTLTVVASLAAVASANPSVLNGAKVEFTVAA
jgi:hypothetical protein